MPRYEKIHCNECGHETKHLLVATREQHDSEPYDEEYDISWDTIYDMLECCGCEDITLRSRYYFSEWNSGDVKTVYYPPRVARHLPAWSKKLSKEITDLLEEVYTALQADSIALSMMGARALIDMVILKEIGEVPKKGCAEKGVNPFGPVAQTRPRARFSLPWRALGLDTQ